MRIYEVICDYNCDNYDAFISFKRAIRFVKEELLPQLFGIKPDTEESNRILNEIKDHSNCDDYCIWINSYPVNTEEE